MDRQIHPLARMGLFLIAGVVFAVAATATAQAAVKPKSSETIWYERIEAGCKQDARRYYSAIQFRKRQKFVKHCINRAYR